MNCCKRLRFWIVICFCFGTLVRAQSFVVDSLEHLYYSESDPTKKIDLLFEAFDYWEQTDREQTIQIARSAHSIAQSQAKENLTRTYNLLGIAYANNSQIDSALYYYELGLERANLFKDSLVMSKLYTNIGALYFATEDYDVCLEYLEKAAKIEMQTFNFADASTTYANMGGIHAQLENFEEGEKMLLKAIELSEKNDDKPGLINAYHNLAYLYRMKHEFEKSKEIYSKEIELCEEFEFYYDAADAYQGLSTVYMEEGDFSNAMMYSNRALKLAKLINDVELILGSLMDLSESAFELNKHREAYLYMSEVLSWRDSLMVRQDRATFIEMERKFQADQTRKENQILQQQNSIAQLENEKSRQDLQQSRIIIWSSIVGLLLLIGMAISLFNRNKIKQRANDELKEANDIIREKNDDITASLEYASKIQEALLPTKENNTLFTDSFFMLLPKDIVSGDFFWYSERNGHKVFTAVDCTGHGVPGAFMSMIGNTFLHEIINEQGITTPGEILNRLREKVVTALSTRDARKDGMDMALCTLDENQMILQYAGANNPLWYWQNGEVKEIKADKQPVGYMPERERPFTNHEIKVNKGDRIYVFSDGYPDQFGGPKGKKFKYKQLRDLIQETAHHPMSEQKRILMDKFHEWKGDLEQIDDVCLVGIEV